MRQFAHPFLPHLALVVLQTAAGGLQHRAEHRAWITDDAEVDVSILADGAVVQIDLHQRRDVDALAVAHAEIERGADNHHHVGFAERHGPGAVEVMGIAGWQDAAGGTVEVAGDVQASQQGHGFLMPPSGPDLLAEQDRRALGVDQDIGQTLDIARVADRLGGGTIVARFR